MTKARDLANVRYTKGSTANRPTGNQGDLYYDTTEDNLYQKNATTWAVAGVANAIIAEMLVVAGGGGGGTWTGGGGGAGGVVGYTSQTFTSGTTHTITVGSGGAGGSYAAPPRVIPPLTVVSERITSVSSTSTRAERRAV